MGCGKARLDRNGQNPPNIENFGLKVCSLGPRGNPHGPRGIASFLILGIFWPFRPYRALPHPITIQNMRFGR